MRNNNNKVSSRQNSDTAGAKTKLNTSSIGYRVAKIARDLEKINNSLQEQLNIQDSELNTHEAQITILEEEVEELKTPTLKTVYLRSTGNDSLDGLTEANAVLTLVRAMEIVREIQQGGVVELGRYADADMRSIYGELNTIDYLANQQNNATLFLPKTPIVLNIGAGTFSASSDTYYLTEKETLFIKGNFEVMDMPGYSSTGTATNGTNTTLEVDFSGGGTPWVDHSLKGKYFFPDTADAFGTKSCALIVDNTHNVGTGITTITLAPSHYVQILPPFTFVFTYYNTTFTIYENNTTIDIFRISSPIREGETNTSVIIKNINFTEYISFSNAVIDKCYYDSAIGNIAVLNCRVSDTYFESRTALYGYYYSGCYFYPTLKVVGLEIYYNYLDQCIVYMGYYNSGKSADCSWFMILGYNYSNGSFVSNHTEDGSSRASVFKLIKNTFDGASIIEVNNGGYAYFDADNKFGVGFSKIDIKQGGILYLLGSLYYDDPAPVSLTAAYFIEVNQGGKLFYVIADNDVVGATDVWRINAGGTDGGYGAGFQSDQDGCVVQEYV